MQLRETKVTSFGKQLLSCVQIPKTQLVVNSFVIKHDVIFIKGSKPFKGSILPHNRGKMDPSSNFTIFNMFKFEFIPRLDTFLFEMQNVIAACSTILFSYLIPIKINQTEN